MQNGHPDDDDDGESMPLVGDGGTLPVSSSIRQRLYTSHFLSTWNSRAFEFGAILFIAKIYPNTLLPASIYALVRAGSAVCLAPAIGRYIDRANRLQVARVSIGLHSHHRCCCCCYPTVQAICFFTVFQSAVCTLVFFWQSAAHIFQIKSCVTDGLNKKL